MSSLNVDDDQRWVPTHVQVTVLRGRGLRAKGKHGTSDVYTIIQVGKEKYSTCVVEKTTSPEWKEECSFELLPGVLEDGGRSAYPPGSSDVILTVMHRALIGLDVFLGQAVIPLDKAFQDNICMRNEWYKLNSKTGKKEKERGDIQVTIQFTRNNLTASMYNLSIKDKQRSAFGKLKDRMRGKKRSSEEDSSSAALPAGYGTLRTRLPSDGGGEEEYEDDEGGEGRRSKMRNFFLRGKLRKSSDTRSSTSLGSESSESSSRGGSLSPTAGISVVVSDLSNSPSNSSNLTDNSPEHTAGTSPQLSPHKCDLSQETGEISFPVPPPPVNGNHVYDSQSQVAVSEEGSVSLRPLQKSLPLSVSLQNLRARAEAPGGGRAADGRRWSFDKAGDEEKAAIAAALELAGVALGEEERLLERVAATTLAAVEADSQGRKQGRNVFAHRREESAGEQSRDESEQARGPAEEKQKGWFGSKDSHSKPSLMVSTKLEPSSESPTTPHPPAPLLTPSSVSLGTLRHTNPFCPSQSPPTPMSPSNPFLPLLQCNPFYEDILADKAINPALPPLPYPSSSTPRPPPPPPSSSPSNPNPTLLGERPLTEGHCGKEASVTVRKRPLPPIPSEDNNLTVQRSSNPFSPSGRAAVGQEVVWDDSFEAFAANRLKSPEEADRHCGPQDTAGTHTTHPLLDAAAGPWTRDSHTHHSHLNVNSALHPSPTAGATLMASTSSSSPEGNTNHMKLLHTQQHDMSAHLSPAQNGLEAHLDGSKTTNPAATSPELMSGCETKHIILTANTVEMSTNAHEHPNTHPSFSSPSPRAGLELEHIKVTSSPGPVGVDRLVEEEVTSSPGPVGVDRLVEEEEEITSSPGPVGVDRLVEEEVIPSPGPVGVDRLVEEEITSSPGPVGVDPTSSETGSTAPVSFEPRLGVPSPQRPGEKREKNPNLEMKDSVAGSAEDAKLSISVTTDDVEANASVSDDDHSLTTPLFYIMTSSPGDGGPLKSSPLSMASGMPSVIQGPPKPARLFSNSLNTSQIRTSPSQGFDGVLLNPRVLDLSPGTPNILYESADSQQYQSCHSQQSSRASSLSGEGHRMETLPPTLPSQSGEEVDCEVGALSWPVTGCKNTVPWELEEEEEQSEGCRVSGNVHIQSEASSLVRMSADEERDAALQPRFLLEDCLSEPHLETHSGAPSDGSRSPPGAEKEGGRGTQAVGSGDQCSEHSPLQPGALHRSLSEGTVTAGLQDLSSSFGSDPGVNLDTSSVRPDPSLPASPNPCPLTASSSTSAPPSLPVPATLRSSVSLALPTACVPAAIGAPHAAMLPPDTQQAANQENSPHAVKPLSVPAEEKGRSALASGLEKLRSTIHPGRSGQLAGPEPERRKSLTEGAGSYYHLTHSELVSLLLRREADLERQRAEFERQGTLLGRREAELRRLKPQVRDLEDYIDTLLVRIMEQTPTLLQVRTKLK
ncbi:mucin-2 isoform X1 [Osmerus eperlanus]|uniref:mucin-2 isoform X1 n=2 Tax=Osmerus eperlanus TaxID=29151 RepID=UPI002E0FD921